MKIVKLTRPALTDPQRHLELQAREAQSGLLDFMLSQAAPSGWLDVEILDEQAPLAPTLPKSASRTG
jgi:hypothetical protein